MSNNRKIASLIALLAIVFVFIGAIVSYDLEQYNLRTLKGTQSSEETLVAIRVTEEAENKNVLVTDRFTGKLEKDSQVISIGSDGSMYVVKGGTVLASDMVIGTNEESTSVYRINDVEKSVSTN